MCHFKKLLMETKERQMKALGWAFIAIVIMTILSLIIN